MEKLSNSQMPQFNAKKSFDSILRNPKLTFFFSLACFASMCLPLAALQKATGALILQSVFLGRRAARLGLPRLRRKPCAQEPRLPLPRLPSIVLLPFILPIVHLSTLPHPVLRIAARAALFKRIAAGATL